MSYHRSACSVFVALSVLLLGFSLVPSAVADEWPGFRGPKGTGESKETGLPTQWGEKDNLAWKTKLPGPGASGPIAWTDRVFVTCWSGYAEKKGKKGDLKDLQRHLVCLDRGNGKILWDRVVPAKQPEGDWGMAISQHGYATNTPVTDGERVYVFYGRTGVLAYDFAGKKLWHVEVGKWVNNFGSGSSPIVWKNLLIVNASVEGTRLVALDKTNGKEVWKLKLYEDCWTTPLLVKSSEGRQELIVMTPRTLRGIDPATGKELWTCECPEPDYVSANPVTQNGVVYVMGSGNLGKVCMAVRTGGKGDVTKSHVLWKQKVGVNYTSPVLAGRFLFFFSDLAYCLDTKTGDIVFRGRLSGLGREYSSPIVADGRIYLFQRDGSGQVIAVKDKLEPIATNRIDDSDSFVASPAVHRGQILVRTNEYLYCLGKGNK